MQWRTAARRSAPFDDEDLAGVTGAEVLADSATLADPLEGVEYGACKAKIMRRTDGTPRMDSFAHGEPSVN